MSGWRSAFTYIKLQSIPSPEQFLLRNDHREQSIAKCHRKLNSSRSLDEKVSLSFAIQNSLEYTKIFKIQKNNVCSKLATHQPSCGDQNLATCVNPHHSQSDPSLIDISFFSVSFFQFHKWIAVRIKYRIHKFTKWKMNLCQQVIGRSKPRTKIFCISCSFWKQWQNYVLDLPLQVPPPPQFTSILRRWL